MTKKKMIIAGIGGICAVSVLVSAIIMNNGKTNKNNTESVVTIVETSKNVALNETTTALKTEVTTTEKIDEEVTEEPTETEKTSVDEESNNGGNYQESNNTYSNENYGDADAAVLTGDSINPDQTNSHGNVSEGGAVFLEYS